MTPHERDLLRSAYWHDRQAKLRREREESIILWIRATLFAVLLAVVATSVYLVICR